MSRTLFFLTILLLSFFYFPNPTEAVTNATVQLFANSSSSQCASSTEVDFHLPFPIDGTCVNSADGTNPNNRSFSLNLICNINNNAILTLYRNQSCNSSLILNSVTGVGDGVTCLLFPTISTLNFTLTSIINCNPINLIGSTGTNNIGSSSSNNIGSSATIITASSGAAYRSSSSPLPIYTGPSSSGFNSAATTYFSPFILLIVSLSAIAAFLILV